MSNTLISEFIIEEARKWLGKKEKPGNMGFYDRTFDKLMRAVGFVDTHAWCVYFTEMVWTETYKRYDDRKLPVFRKLFTGGAVRTFRRFKKDPRFKISNTPVKGGICFWQTFDHNGKPTSRGHAGVAEHTTTRLQKIRTIDGNTDGKGGREGVEVADKGRRYNLGETRGLVFLGCVLPPGIEGTDW